MVLKVIEWINKAIYKKSPDVREVLKSFVAGHKEVTKRRWARIAIIRGGIHTSDSDPDNHLTVLLKKYQKHRGFKVHMHIEPEGAYRNATVTRTDVFTEAEECVKNFKK